MSDYGTPSPYGYQPVIALSVSGTVAFCAVTVYLVFRCLQRRCWVLLPIIIGALMEAIGYVARTISSIDLTDLNMFLIQYLTIILAPSFLAAGCYMVFGRLVWWVTPRDQLNARRLWCPPRWITPLFVLFDLFSFLVQLAGIAQVGSAFKENVDPQEQQKDMQGGLHILKFGLVLQLVGFSIFALLGVRFFVISRKWIAPDGSTSWRRLNLAVNGAASLITLRAIYRVFEFTGSTKGGARNYLNTHEWVFWVCDALPILLTLLLYCLVLPSSYLPRYFIRFRLNEERIWASKAQDSSDFVSIE